jgi:hypothetical protein
MVMDVAETTKSLAKTRLLCRQYITTGCFADATSLQKTPESERNGGGRSNLYKPPNLDRSPGLSFFSLSFFSLYFRFLLTITAPAAMDLQSLNLNINPAGHAIPRQQPQ